MSFAIRSEGNLVADLLVTERSLRVGAAETADLRLAADGVEALHLRVDVDGIEALADCEVGGVPLKRGGRRALVPCTITLGTSTVEIVHAEASAEIPTRELAMLALEGPGSLWPYAVVVEGASLGRTLVLREERTYRVGRGPSCDLVVDDPEASREHLEILRRSDEILVRDLDSLGGTWLGRRRLDAGRKAEWPSQRMLRIGATVIALVPPPRLAEAAPRKLQHRLPSSAAEPASPSHSPEELPRLSPEMTSEASSPPPDAESSAPVSPAPVTSVHGPTAPVPFVARPSPTRGLAALARDLRSLQALALCAVVLAAVAALVYLAFAGR